ncbi:hypothetical protein MACJ_000345 [Theileria orientalis]|uniref:DNL-type domain-containing protein n=1 Tax=Theileria orientalis TaxID=68886 RepID=A0A976M3W4_THEOR|nr:hypothetical protein MACJ_000345 [Theileria orientalis]
MFWRVLPFKRFITSICVKFPSSNPCISNKFNSFSTFSYLSRSYSTKSDSKHESINLSETSSNKDRYIAVFTCNICDHRSAKSFSKQAYNHGIVYVRCESCKSLHLISDQLGWFGDKQNIEEILSRKGHHVSKMELGQDVSESDLKLISNLKDNKYFKE